VTVPTTRQVARGRVDWWEVDRAGAPLTPALAFHLRRITTGHVRLNIIKGLARRGLHAGLYAGQPAIGLTPEGERVRALLGVVPGEFWSVVRTAVGTPGVPSEAVVECSSCGKLVNVELIAWGAGLACLACALPGEEGTT
jgi:hypothetical protein